jgi:orotidine-5'-phosphate decarboxylase
VTAANVTASDVTPSSVARSSSVARPTFGERLVDAVGRAGPLCAGIDPTPELLAAWGLADDAEGLATFVRRCLDAYAGVVAVVKPQLAFFERHGSAGLAVLEELLARARAVGLLVIADAKRGDIGSTAAGYADAWLGSGPLGADAMTAVAYLGLGALGPLVDAARAHGRGLFVVVRSSNPEGRVVQSAVTADGRPLDEALLAELAEMNAADGAPVGALGAVIGVTGQPWAAVASLGGPVLAPGVGAQGGSVADAAALFAGCRPGTVVVNESRSLLAAGPDPTRLRQAAQDAQKGLRAAFA